MRAAVLCLALAALAGCSPSDPVLERPCGQRGDPFLQVGTGQYVYVPVGAQGTLIETDPDLATNFLWFAAGARGLGPDVNLSYGVKDVATGIDLTGTLTDRVVLTYDSSANLDEATGLSAYFTLDPMGQLSSADQLVNRELKMWIDATDTCYPDAPGPASPRHAEVNTQVAGFDPADCGGCLDQACGTQLGACDAECMAIQACLDAYCTNLSIIASPDEVECQVYCQSLHLAGKAAHLALVDCVQTSVCQPPCYGFPLDFKHCVKVQDGAPCATQLAACNASADCLAYQTCTEHCSTWAECQACAQTPGGNAGELLYEAHRSCVESACIAQGWLPHLLE